MTPDDQRPWKGEGCLVYRRCSTDGQDASLGDQEATVFSERARLGLTRVLAAFEDDGKKGHDEARPGLRAILSHVRTHPNPVRSNADFVPILVYDLARFGRFDDPKKIFAYFVEIEKYGYEFYSVTEKIRSRGNIADFVQAIVKSEQAYDYSVSLSKYGLRTGCSLAQKGFWPGGAAPYAYDRMTYGADGKPKYRFATLPDKTVEKRTPEGELVESIPAILDKGRTRSAYSDKIKTDKVKLAPGNSKQVKVVEFIFRKFAEEDWGIRRIAQALNARGEEPPRGRFWLHTSVRSILLNPAYKGALVYGRRSDGKHHWLEIEKKDGRYETRIERKDVPGRTFVHRTEEQCIVVEECHEALVGRELWEKAQAKLRDRKYGKIRGLGVRSTFLLSGDGLMSCAHCGYRFQGDTDRRHRTRRYVDGGYHMGGKGVCRCYMVPAEPLEGWIVDEIQARILDGRARLFASREELEGAIEEALVAGRETASADDSEVKTLEQQLADRKAKVELLLSSVSAENVRLLDEHLGRLRKEIEAIESELRAVLVADRARDIVTRDVKALAKEAAGYIVNLREVLEKGTPDEKKRFIRDFVGSIVVDGEKRQVQVGFFEDEDDGSGAGGLVALARRAAGETAPLWSMAPWGHLAHESALVDRMMTLRHFGAAVAAAMMLSACGKRDPDESASAGEDPTAGLPARFKTDEPVPRPDFTEAAKSQAFQLAIKQAAETLGSQPQPLLSPGENGELTGGVSFQVPHGKLEAILRKAHTDFLARGYYLFRREQEYGHGGKMDQVGLLPTADKYVVMAAMETNGINWEIGTAGVIAWMKELEKEQPFILTGIGFDYLEGHFTRPVKDPQGLAKRMYQFCPDIVDQGVNTLSALAQELKKGTLYFWWD